MFLSLKNFLKRDHALASIAAIFIFVGTLLTQVAPQFNVLDLSPDTAAWIAVVAAACGVIGGALKKMPALTYGGAITLAYQVVLLLNESAVSHDPKTRKVLVLVSALLVVLSKLTAADWAPNNPLATGAKTDPATPAVQPPVTPKTDQ